MLRWCAATEMLVMDALDARKLLLSVMEEGGGQWQYSGCSRSCRRHCVTMMFWMWS